MFLIGTEMDIFYSNAICDGAIVEGIQKRFKILTLWSLSRSDSCNSLQSFNKLLGHTFVSVEGVTFDISHFLYWQTSQNYIFVTGICNNSLFFIFGKFLLLYHFESEFFSVLLLLEIFRKWLCPTFFSTTAIIPSLVPKL